MGNYFLDIQYKNFSPLSCVEFIQCIFIPLLSVPKFTANLHCSCLEQMQCGCSMALMLDGSSEHGAHILRVSGNCLNHGTYIVEMLRMYKVK